MFAACLEKDHREIDTIYREAVNALWADDVVPALEKVDLLWGRLAVHIRAEHLRLFPAIVANSQDPAIVDLLRQDHSEFMASLAEAVKMLREPAPDAGLKEARQIVLGLGERLAEHNRLEEETVYRNAAVGKSEKERAELVRAIENEIGNLPPRFLGG